MKPKKKCYIYTRVSTSIYDLPKSEDFRQLQCPPEKTSAIRSALEHFGMIES